MAAQIRKFLDRPRDLWARGALVGKVGSVFTGTATQHGRQETRRSVAHDPMGKTR
jgi:NAD(P)H dehydrogenase (quinone)